MAISSKITDLQGLPFLSRLMQSSLQYKLVLAVVQENQITSDTCSKMTSDTSPVSGIVSAVAILARQQFIGVR